jgi:predicted dehydrogenase
MIKIGIIGYGYWGPNVVRNFVDIEGVKVSAVCDKNPATIRRLAKNHPCIDTLSDSNEILSSPDIDAVAIVTPVSTHYELAKKALLNGKHVFVEKPFTDSSAHAEELVSLAKSKNLVIMVDHTFLFTGAVRKIRSILDEGQLGKVFYYDSTRVNLGLFQHDVNVVWDLAPHDFSIMNYVLSERPTGISACGRSHVNNFEDITYINVAFTSNLIAHFTVNWLSPVKVRNTLIGGEKRMLVWDDLQPDEKIKLYDRGVDITSKQGIYDLLVSYRSGDMLAPKINQGEALRQECAYFVECVEKSATPINDGVAGLRVVEMLEACDRSLKADGDMVKI